MNFVMTQDRYRTLNGGVWDARHPRRTLTKIMAASVVAPAACIALMSVFNDEVVLERDLETALITSVGAALMMNGIRRMQGGILRDVAPGTVIDTNPPVGVINSDIVRRNGEAGTWAMTYGPTNLLFTPLNLAILYYPFASGGGVPGGQATATACMASFAMTVTLCQIERRNQLKRIAEDQWVLVPEAQARATQTAPAAP